jgi:hypothetical protein
MVDAQKYRNEAAKLRRDAEKVLSPVIKRQLLEIAARYERLAKSIESAKSRNRS